MRITSSLPLIDPRDAEMFRPFVLPEEKLLWAGRPQRGLRLRRADWFYIPYSILWSLGFGIPVLLAWDSSIPVIRYGVAALFGLAALYLLVGRFFHDSFRRKTTRYAVTTERVIIRGGLVFQRTRSHWFVMAKLLLVEWGDSRGSIKVADEGSHVSILVPGPGAGWVTDIHAVLYGIEDVVRVYNLISEAHVSIRKALMAHEIRHGELKF